MKVFQYITYLFEDCIANVQCDIAVKVAMVMKIVYKSISSVGLLIS